MLDIAPECTSLARALSIEADVLSVPGLTSCVVSTGETRHLLVPFSSLPDLKRVQVDTEKLRSLVRPFGCEGCYCYSLDAVSRTSLAHARGFFPGISIVEGPATGSAAGQLGAHLVAYGMVPEDEWFKTEQGDGMSRPGRIEVRVSGERIDVGGGCVVVGSGTIALQDRDFTEQ